MAAALKAADDARPIYRWVGFIDGKPDLDATYKTKADAKALYQDARRVQIVLAGKVTGLRGRQPK